MTEKGIKRPSDNDADLKLIARVKAGETDAVTMAVIKDLQHCNIDFTQGNDALPKVAIVFTKKGKLYEAMINVTSASGKSMVSDEQLVFKNEKGTGHELALRLFGKGGVVEFEEEPKPKLP